MCVRRIQPQTVSDQIAGVFLMVIPINDPRLVGQSQIGHEQQTRPAPPQTARRPASAPQNAMVRRAVARKNHHEPARLVNAEIRHALRMLDDPHLPKIGHELVAIPGVNPPSNQARQPDHPATLDPKPVKPGRQPPAASEAGPATASRECHQAWRGNPDGTFVDPNQHAAGRRRPEPDLKPVFPRGQTGRVVVSLGPMPPKRRPNARAKIAGAMARHGLHAARNRPRDPRAPRRRTAARVVQGTPPDRSRQAEAEVVKVWNSLIDPAVTAHAQPANLHKGTLFVNVDSSVWLSEIVRYRYKEILGRLQSSFGKSIVQKISFRIGP